MIEKLVVKWAPDSVKSMGGKGFWISMVAQGKLAGTNFTNTSRIIKAYSPQPLVKSFYANNLRGKDTVNK